MLLFNVKMVRRSVFTCVGLDRVVTTILDQS